MSATHETTTVEISKTEPTMGILSGMEPVISTPAANVNMASDLLTNLTDGQSHALKEFLARPVVIRTGTWDSNGLAGSSLATIAIPEDIIQGSRVFSQKIFGFFAFRAKAVLRLQVNANRFQQGRLLMTFFPQDNLSQRKQYTVGTSLHYQTQLPRVDFDVATDTEVTMEIPYVSPYLAYDTTIGTGHVGAYNLLVYSPLSAAAGELNVEYTIWAHFEDIELMFPTISNNTLVPQAGGGRRMRVGRRDPLEQEAEGKPISSALIRVSNAAHQLSFVPGLSSFMGSASWAVSAAANAAASFGFSNPMSDASVSTVQQRVFANAVNSNGQDNCVPLAVDAENKIEMLPGFASSGLDEMSFAYPLSISTFHSDVIWSDSVIPLNVLMTIDLCPNQFTYVSGSGRGLTDTTPVSYLSNFFTYWRGSFRFKFKFVKTEFHSGRLAFVFVPGYTATTVPVLTDANMSYLHRDIVDIRSLTEYEVVCPWVANVPYMRPFESYGKLVVAVINELRHPDTVQPLIHILTEVSCCNDFEFSVPATNPKTPALIGTNATSQAGVGLDGQPLEETTTMEAPQPTIGTSIIVSDSLSAARFAAGESIRSWRQLCKRATPFQAQDPSVETVYQLFPWINELNFFNDSTNNQTRATSITDYYTCMVNCYAFMRGSMRLRFYSPQGQQPIERVTMSTNMTTNTGVGSFRADTTPTSTLRLQTMEPVVPCVDNVYPNPEISVPYYNKFTHSTVTSGNFGMLIESNPTQPLITVLFIGQTSFNITRQIGEDFSAGFWTGSLPLSAQTNLSSRMW